MTIPLPGDTRTDGPNSAAARTTTPLTPYKTAAGYWIFVPYGTQPAGAVEGSFVSGTGYVTLQTTTTAGKHPVRMPSGYVAIL